MMGQPSTEMVKRKAVPRTIRIPLRELDLTRGRQLGTLAPIRCFAPGSMSMKSDGAASRSTEFSPAASAAVSHAKAAAPTQQIRRVAVLGAGTMGSRIAAHIANAGIPVVLLDIVPAGTPADAAPSARNKLVLSALDSLKKSKPAAFYAIDSARLITPGNFDDHLNQLADCDWIIEAVAENVDIKRALLAKVAEHRTLGG